VATTTARGSTRSGTGSGKPPVTAGSNGQRPAQYGYGRRKPQSELEIDDDKLAETGGEWQKSGRSRGRMAKLVEAGDGW